jgi:hypothetical protein
MVMVADVTGITIRTAGIAITVIIRAVVTE